MCLCVGVCVCGGGGMYMLRIVSMDKILHFIHTLTTIIITLH